MFDVKRGDIYYADLGDGAGSEQCGVRPVVVIQNDIGNRHSPTTIVAVITSQDKPEIPTHIKIKAGESGLQFESTILLEQVRTLDISKRFKSKIGRLSPHNMQLLDKATGCSVGVPVPQVLIMLNMQYLKEINKLKQRLLKMLRA